MAIKHPKDFWTGVLYLAIGAGSALASTRYGMGSAVRMGPGYFPAVLGILLAVVGLVSLVRGFLRKGAPITPFAWKSLALILGGIVLFGLLVSGAGLVVALLLLVLMSAWASVHFRLRSALLLAVCTTAFSVLVFVKALGVPLPILGSWFGK